MIIRSEQIKATFDYQQVLADKNLQNYYKNTLQNENYSLSKSFRITVTICDQYGSFKQVISLLTLNQIVIVTNDLINGLQYPMNRLFKYDKRTSKRALINIKQGIKHQLLDQLALTKGQFCDNVNLNLGQNNIFQYSCLIRLSPKTFKYRYIYRKGPKIFRITQIQLNQQFKVQSIQNDNAPLSSVDDNEVINLTDKINEQNQDQDQNSCSNQSDQFQKLEAISPDGACQIHTNIIVNKNGNIRKMESISNIQFSGCSKIFTCKNECNVFHIINSSTLQDIFTQKLIKEISRFHFDFEKSFLIETVGNIIYKTFIFRLLDSSEDLSLQNVQI